MGEQERSLYVFVDESGNHSRKDCYTVAACWCVTQRNNPTNILKPTKRKIVSKFLGDDTGQELKGEKITNCLNEVFYVLPSLLESDDSIHLYNLPWDEDISAVRYTVYQSDSSLGIAISEEHLGESGTGTTPQLIALASVISPLLRMEGPEHAPISRRHVVLDDTTWERPRYTLSKIVEGIDWSPDIRFETRKSHNAPGIQLADIAAHHRRNCVQNHSSRYESLAKLLI